MKKITVSIIIVNWNGKRYLKDCIESLLKASYKRIEIIVVDQGSKDGSQEMIKKKFPQVNLIENKENTGYVGGNNLGVRRAKGQYVLILNNDVVVDRNFLEPLINAMEKDKKLGCVQPKAISLRKKDRLDGGGSFFTLTGFLNHYGFMEKANDERFSKSYFVYSVKGAYMLIRKDLYDKLGGLDEDFFIYFEESDLCGRIWVAGYKVKYIPESVVYHWGGGDTESVWKKKFALVQYRSCKNRICSYLKNLSGRKLLIVLPIHILLCQGLAFYYLLTLNARTFLSIEKAIVWNLVNLGDTIRKRKKIQKLRKRMDGDIFKLVEKNRGLLYYLNQLKILRSGF